MCRSVVVMFAVSREAIIVRFYPAFSLGGVLWIGILGKLMFYRVSSEVLVSLKGVANL